MTDVETGRQGAMRNAYRDGYIVNISAISSSERSTVGSLAGREFSP